MSSKPLLVAVLVAACMTSVQPWAGAAPRGGAQQALLDNVPEFKSVAVELAGDCDRLVFVGDSITISIDKVGLAHPSGRMQAYDTQSGGPLWQGEVPLGRPGMVLDNYLWLDEATGTLFIGNGPLSAIDARTGRVLWTKDYDDVGLVWEVHIGKDRILVHGSKKLGATIAIKAGAEGAEAALEPMRRHMRNPRLICANRTTGATLWECTFTAPKERGSTTHVPMGIDGYGAEAVWSRERLSAAPAPVVVPGTAGMRVHIDPETGGLSVAPYDEELADGVLDLNDSVEGLVEVVFPDGSAMLDLQGRFQQYTVMTLGPDGRFVMRCGPNPRHLHRLPVGADLPVEE